MTGRALGINYSEADSGAICACNLQPPIIRARQSNCLKPGCWRLYLKHSEKMHSSGPTTFSRTTRVHRERVLVNIDLNAIARHGTEDRTRVHGKCRIQIVRGHFDIDLKDPIDQSWRSPYVE